MNAFICEYYNSLLYVVKKILASVTVFTVIMHIKDILQKEGREVMLINWKSTGTQSTFRLLMNVRESYIIRNVLYIEWPLNGCIW